MGKQEITMNEFKYFAFISYSSRDTKWGKQVQRKLESYRLPAELCSQHGWEKRPLKPVFFAPTDIQPGNLSEELKARLRASRNLIVICSPHSAKSEWVGKEIEYFHELGRTDQIHFFIVEGTPHSGDPETECFNPVVNDLNLPEILGANIHENNFRWPWLNRERAYVQLISKLLGVEFDSIWNRHRRQLIRKAVFSGLGILAVIVGMMIVRHASLPVDIHTTLREASIHNPSLPELKDAIVSLYLDDEVKTDTLQSIRNDAVFKNVPRRYLNKPVRFTVDCRDCLVTDTTLNLKQLLSIDLKRDESVYGRVHFRLWDAKAEKDVGGIPVQVGDFTFVSDRDGFVDGIIPLDKQLPRYPLAASVPLLTDTLTMPSGEDDIVSVK